MTSILLYNQQNKALRKRKAMDFAIGAAIGVVVFLLIFGPSTLNVTYDGWIYAGYMEEDVIQHYTGWLYFRAAEWAWPLTVAENLSIPYGASVVFTDSVPLVAVVCKLFAPVLPATFQYFGWVNLCNFALQGGFACLLLRHFAVGRIFMALGSLVFLLNPIFVERAFRHAALGCQWFILAALYFYFVARRKGPAFPVVGFFVLCVLTVWIHSYFTPMVFALLLAALLENAFRERKILRPALVMVACLFGALCASYPAGILTRGGDGGTSGFGSYSMNLNALFNPASFDWFAGDGERGGQLVWSGILPVQPQNYHQYDGFNYLGAGMLAAVCLLCLYGVVRLVIALVKRQHSVLQRAWMFLASHLWLVLMCLCLFIFALSNKAVWGQTTLYDIPLPDALLRIGAIFRSSGRLFWPVNYLLCLSVLVATARFLRGWGKHVALAVLITLQLVDFGGVLVQKHQDFAGEPIVVEDEFTTGGWQFLMENYDTVLCLGNIVDYRLAAGIIRYNPDMQSNIILVNRGNFGVIEASYAPTIKALSEGGEIEPGVLYIASDEGTFEHIRRGMHGDIRGYNTGKYYLFGIPVEGNPLEEYLPIWMEA